jgi:hypothetical protein
MRRRLDFQAYVPTALGSDLLSTQIPKFIHMTTNFVGVIKPLSQDLMRITGRQEPSGIPCVTSLLKIRGRLAEIEKRASPYFERALTSFTLARLSPIKFAC